MTTISIQQAAEVRVPRAAPIAAEIAFRIWAALERLVHAHHERQAEATRLAEATAVRRYADEVRSLDPRFAADLYAAADRHEIG